MSYSFYRAADTALVRAAVMPLSDLPGWWPDLSDGPACRSWLDTVWASPTFAAAVRQASPSLAVRVEEVRAGRAGGARVVRRVTAAVVRYLLRAVGRPTPFGLFAGVALAGVAGGSDDGQVVVRWGGQHRSVARVDTEWLADVVDRLEGEPVVLARLELVASNLAIPRGPRLELPRGPNRVTVRRTAAVDAAMREARRPVRFDVLADTVAGRFDCPVDPVRKMLVQLVREGFLLSELRAPSTTVDPTRLVLDRAQEAKAGPAAELVHELTAIQAEIAAHNQMPAGRAQDTARTALTERMGRLSPAGRAPLAVDVALDCDLRLPAWVTEQMARAAGVLLRLSRRPAGEPVWQDYHRRFCDRYGTGTSVRVSEVADPDAGLGWPAGYPGSVLPEPPDVPTARDERLLGLAWQALAEGCDEIVLTDDIVASLVEGDRFDPRRIPAHVEMAARIHAPSTAALTAGKASLVVAPARSAGTLTSRFSPLADGSGLAAVYRELPVSVEGAVAVQMSFPPVYSHAENVTRIPAYLPRLLSLGEHRHLGQHPPVASGANGDGPGSGQPSDGELLGLDDLAITATADRLYLVEARSGQVLEPQAFHALALDKQAAPLARFLAHLSRGFAAGWYQFDWGPHVQLPFLPRVRYQRAVLSPARWRLTRDELAPNKASRASGLARWQQRWRCPDVVELRDDDRGLRLDLTQPAHQDQLYRHLDRNGHAVLAEASPADELGWIDGHVHEVAVPLTRTTPAASGPVGTRPVVTNRSHGQLPFHHLATNGQRPQPGTWVNLKIYSHPDRFNDILTRHTPQLTHALDQLGCPGRWWFVRYRALDDPDHLRVRVQADSSADTGRVVGDWLDQLRQDQITNYATIEPYYPEVGRYGTGDALSAAETVFATDSMLVAASLDPPSGLHPMAWATINLVGIVTGFFNRDEPAAMAWLAAQPAPESGPALDRVLADEAIDLALRHARSDTYLTTELRDRWRHRTWALAAYQPHVPPTRHDTALKALLHMHHNRALGPNQADEATGLRLARHAALRWLHTFPAAASPTP